MTSFDFLWQLLESHGVIPNKKEEAARLWNTFTLDEQRRIYKSIRDKIREGKFVNYNPVIAINNNRSRGSQIISADEYYRRYGTQTNHDGWVRRYLPDQQKTIYVKQT